jgi:SAM-dependent methyltransferase
MAMSKRDEIDYVRNIAKVLSVDDAQVLRSLSEKPWNDAKASRYFFDFSQILSLLPPPPGQVLDLGVGPGWSSIFLARCGYSVLGLDIAPDMVRIASENIPTGLSVQFLCHDYELSFPADGFDAVLIYDALHHACDAGAVIRNAHGALRNGGIFVTIEPGRGHSKGPESLQAVARFGTTEKDMEFKRQVPLMRSAGFREVRQYLRLSELPLVAVNRDAGTRQVAQALNLAINTMIRGLSSIVVAVK